MKDAYYFRHDANAHNDPKMLYLRLKIGWEGVGLFWTFLEILRDLPKYRYPCDNGYLDELELRLRHPKDKLEEFIKIAQDAKLLVKKDNSLCSASFSRRMREIDRRRRILSQAGRRGGLTRKTKDQASLKPGLSHPQAVKESKVKESKLYIPPQQLNLMLEEKLGKIATPDMIFCVLKEIPEKLWWRVDAFLKDRYKGGGNGFTEATERFKKTEAGT